jgi:multiple sugar transport system permease protein
MSIRSRLRWAGFFFVLPALLHLLIFKFYPLLGSVPAEFLPVRSHESARVHRTGELPGAVGQPALSPVVLGLGKYMLGVSVPEWFLALGLALLLNRAMPGRSVIRLAYFFPIAMSQIVVAMVWKFMYHPHGLVNTLLEVFGVGRINWMSTEETALASLIAIGILAGHPALRRDLPGRPAVDPEGLL